MLNHNSSKTPGLQQIQTQDADGEMRLAIGCSTHFIGLNKFCMAVRARRYWSMFIAEPCILTACECFLWCRAKMLRYAHMAESFCGLIALSIAHSCIPYGRLQLDPMVANTGTFLCKKATHLHCGTTVT